MGVLAKILFQGKEYIAKEIIQSMYQGTDETSKPNARSTGHTIVARISESELTEQLRYNMINEIMFTIEFLFVPVTGNGKSDRLILKDTIISSSEIYFFHETGLEMIIGFRAAIVNYNGEIFYEHWKVSDITPPKMVESTPVPRENKPKKKDFDIAIKHLKSKKTFVPLGILAFSGNKENKYIEFEIEVSKNAVESYTIEIIKGGSTIYTAKSGEDEFPQTYGVGKHIFKWDGFDNSGKYDSKAFTKGKFKAKVTGSLEGVTKTAESEKFLFERTEETWVDVIIDKVSKRIDVALRVNLRDGGEKGTEKDCHIVGSGSYASERKICPWDKIPEELIKKHGEPIKNRTKSFEELRDMALEGINRYWSRRFSNTEGTLADGTNYEVIVNAVQDKNGMKAPKIIFVTNEESGRSRNWELSRILYFNVGFLFYNDWNSLSQNKDLFKNQGWYYVNDDDDDYKMTSAHEIGHEILLAYGGHKYSKSHKGSSTIITQKDKNIPLPQEGEIDLMKYYDQYYDIQRTVVSMKDALGIIWLTKMNLK